MPSSHVSMHGVPHAGAVRHARCIGDSSNHSYMSTMNHRPSKQWLGIHRPHKHKQSGLYCFNTYKVPRSSQRVPLCCIAAASSSSVAEERPSADSDLSLFVDIANELAELAGSITKKFFRYSVANDFATPKQVRSVDLRPLCVVWGRPSRKLGTHADHDAATDSH